MEDVQHLLQLEGYWFVGGAPFVSRLKRINGELRFQFFLMKSHATGHWNGGEWTKADYESVEFQQYMESVEVNGMTAQGKDFKSAQGISFSFSRPSGGAGTVRLTAAGLPALRTNSSDAGGSVRCSGGTIDLSFPAELGRTATGSCLAG